MECEYKCKYNWLSLFIALLVQQCWIRFYFFQLFSQHREIAGDLKSYEFWNYWVVIRASWTFPGFIVTLWDIGFLDKDLSVLDLDLLETGINSFPVNFFLSPRSLEDCLKKYLKDVSKTFLEDVFSVTTSCYKNLLRWRSLQASSRHVLKPSSRRLGDQGMFAGNFSN